MPTDTSGTDGNETPRPLIAEIRVPAVSVGLATTMRDLSEGRIEVEQLVPNGHDQFSYVWVSGVAPTAFVNSVADDPTITDARCHATFDAGTLYELEWAEPREPLQTWLRRYGVPILQTEASSDTETWYLKLRLPSRDRLTDLQTYCDERDVNLDLRRLYMLDRPKLGQFGVSEKQLTALLAAYEMGYFEIPRGCTLSDVSERLGLSTEATSERVRRGLTNLLSDSLVVGTPSTVGVDADE